MNLSIPFRDNPLYLMDASAFIYRGFYANQNMQRADGFPTGALHIVARILLRIFREEKPNDFIFVLDGHAPTFRHELYALYKAHRNVTPEGLIQQIDPIKRLVQALGIPIIISDGYEADDCLASLVAHYSPHRPIILVATDKDLRQCLRSNVLMWDPAIQKEKFLTLETFMQETGLQPDQWADLQAMVGDATDNIPGIAGIGPKTAEKILRDFPKLEDIQANFAKLPLALQKKLQNHFEELFLYRKLTTLVTDLYTESVPVDPKRRPIDRKKAAMLLREFELNTLDRELTALIHDGHIAVTKAIPQEQSTLLPSPKMETQKICRTLSSLLDELHQNTFENATIALLKDDQRNELLLALNEIPKKEFIYQGDIAPLIERLTKAECLITPDVKKLLRAMPLWKKIQPNHWFDLGLASYLFDPEERDYSWAKIFARWSIELDQQNPALLALALAKNLQKRLANTDLLHLMTTLELPLIPVLVDMEEAGIMIDAEALTQFLKEVQKELDRLTEEVYTAAGEKFNIRSAQQIGELLFHKLRLPMARKTKGGQASTSQDVLEKLSGSHPVVDALLEFRKLEKLRSTYLEPLPRFMSADARIRTSFNQLATATGRLSSSEPNLQNIPVRGKLGQRMRSCFTAPQGALLISADYSQIELRVLAHLSQDDTLIEAFQKKDDIHAKTASLLFDVPVNDVSPDQRRNAKMINFGLIYGMGPQKLARELKISLNDAKAFINRYFEHLHGLKRFYENVEKEAEENGFVTTLAGRRRLFPDIHSENTQIQSSAKRQAFNTLIQGSAADIIKIAMITVFHDTKLRTMQARLLLQIHDELILEVPKQYATQAGERVASLMESVAPASHPLRVPLVADWGMGQNWGQAHS